MDIPQLEMMSILQLAASENLAPNVSYNHVECEEDDKHNPYIDNILSVVAEAGYTLKACKAAAATIDALTRNKCCKVREGSLEPLLHILGYVVPQMLVLHISKDPDTIPFLEEAMETILQYPTRLGLYLDHGIYVKGANVNDNIIRLLEKHKVMIDMEEHDNLNDLEEPQCAFHCKVEGFHGRLSDCGLRMLPASLVQLSLRITTDQIPALNAVLPTLTYLQELDLCVEAEERPSVSFVHTIKFNGPLLSVNIVASIVDLEVDWAVSLMDRLMPDQTNNCYIVGYINTYLTLSGMSELGKRLKSVGLLPSGFVGLDTRVRITKHERWQLYDLTKILQIPKVFLLSRE
ncbi:unnamed protein product [Meganyctiphanes norvegica]|uniref:Uncharacterized protein n=1 Tax=Meganyctiphanes norvegica TaxID=48144 RepID=A0AAV2PVN6_MEGNR